MSFDRQSRPRMGQIPSSHEERVARLSALLDEQEAMRRVANEYARRHDIDQRDSVVDVAHKAGAAAIILRHHLARLGVDVGECPGNADARENAMRKAIDRKMPDPLPPSLFNNLQRRLTRRLCQELRRSEGHALTETLGILSARERGPREGQGVDANS